jgi:hypothetical protein
LIALIDLSYVTAVDTRKEKMISHQTKVKADMEIPITHAACRQQVLDNNNLVPHQEATQYVIPIDYKLQGFDIWKEFQKYQGFQKYQHFILLARD